MKSWEMGDPLKVLMRKGQSCERCAHLETVTFFGKSVIACTNQGAPQNRRERAPARRCWQFTVEKGNPNAS